MSSSTWLILDVSYLCHRNFHVHGQLSYDDVPTGVVYGMLRDINTLTERFGTNNFAFCFDAKPYLRNELYPPYKLKKNLSIHKDVEESKTSLRRQIKALRDDYLPSLGYKNIFWKEGYEADDVMASVCLSPNESAVLVSCDHDLYQLLGKRVSIYKPREKLWYTRHTFRAQFYGLEPKLWAEAKALAGCVADNIPGCRGVGDITAAKYLTKNKIPMTTVKYIAEWLRSSEYVRNQRLVTLPLPGGGSFFPEPHAPVKESAWESLTKRLGITSLCQVRSER
jgi:DNA polymerase-1